MSTDTDTKSYTPTTREKVYEIAYLLEPTIPEEDINDEATEIAEIVKDDHDGKVITAATPELIDLAYSMEHTTGDVSDEFDKAYFVWMHAAVDTADIEAVQEELRTREHVIRLLCMSIDPEQIGNTPTSQEEDDEADDAADEEEMDEAIDELVIEE